VDTIIELLSSVKIIGPIGLVALIEAWAIYRLFNLYKESLEKRLNDWQAMNKDYQDLSTHINSTLDTVLKVIGKKNGNGNGGNGNG
jgi:hypothetical protein